MNGPQVMQRLDREIYSARFEKRAEDEDFFTTIRAALVHGDTYKPGKRTKTDVRVALEEALQERELPSRDVRPEVARRLGRSVSEVYAPVTHALSELVRQRRIYHTGRAWRWRNVLPPDAPSR